MLVIVLLVQCADLDGDCTSSPRSAQPIMEKPTTRKVLFGHSDIDATYRYFFCLIDAELCILRIAHPKPRKPKIRLATLLRIDQEPFYQLERSNGDKGPFNPPGPFTSIKIKSPNTPIVEKYFESQSEGGLTHTLFDKLKSCFENGVSVDELPARFIDFFPQRFRPSETPNRKH